MNKTFKYIVLLALACFVGKANAQELKTEVFSLLNLDYPGLEKVKALHQEGKDADAAKALLDYYRARTNVKTPDINLKKVTIGKDEQKMADEALQHTFFAHKGYQPSFNYGEDIDWRYGKGQRTALAVAPPQMVYSHGQGLSCKRRREIRRRVDQTVHRLDQEKPVGEGRQERV